MSDYITLKGYLKDMQISSFANNLNDITSDNLLHNRLNCRFYPSKSIRMGLEVRNRVFTGESVEMSLPPYGSLVDKDDGFLDMSWLLVDEPALVFLTQIDRAWVQWANETWEVRAGRQRINWGMNLFWNSNDLFNAYSLVDFDYEERPGSDALRVQRHFKNLSTVDAVITPGKDTGNWAGVVRYGFNKWQYDFQLLGGCWNTDYTIGAGWAGNAGTAGFKGEVTYFHPRENREDTSGILSASVSMDYVFGNQFFLTGGLLFNSAGVDTTFYIASNLFVSTLSAKNLMPAKYSGIVSVSYPFTPIFSGGIVSIYSPGVNTAFFMPSLGYAFSDNWEIALYGQSFWMQLGSFKNIGNGMYVRIKWSF